MNIHRGSFHSRLFFCSVFCVMLALSGCATLRPGYEMPTVQVTTFKVMPGSGLTPKFSIGLHILNPNNRTLDLKGIYYTVSIEEHQILAGVSNQLSSIAAYGHGELMLEVSADVLNSLKLIADLSRQPRERFKYKFKAKLDLGTFQPAIRIVKEGELSLLNLTN